MKKSKHSPIRPEIASQMKRIGKIIGNSLPNTHLFALLIMDKGDKGHISYMSNANREDMIKCLKEFIGNLEAENKGEN